MRRILVATVFLVSAIWALSLPAGVFIQCSRHKIPATFHGKLFFIFFFYFAVTIGAAIGIGISRKASR
jgi:hypothetical protein